MDPQQNLMMLFAILLRIEAAIWLQACATAGAAAVVAAALFIHARVVSRAIKGGRWPSV